MELRQLHHLTALAKGNSLSETAKELFVSQATLSRSLSDLERELGISLFDRSGRKLTINSNGIFFAQRAQALLDDLEDACNAVAEGVAERQRVINCVTSVPLGFLAASLKKFTARHPDVAIKMGYPESSLLDGESIDIKIFDSMKALPEADGQVELAREELVVVLPPDHKLAGQPSIRLADLQDDPFIMGTPSEMRTAVEAMFDKAGFTPRVMAESYLYGDILALAQSGNGCCIAAPITWFTENTIGCYTVKPLSDVKCERILYAQLGNEGKVSAAAKEFVSFLACEGRISYPQTLSSILHL